MRDRALKSGVSSVQSRSFAADISGWKAGRKIVPTGAAGAYSFHNPSLCESAGVSSTASDGGTRQICGIEPHYRVQRALHKNCGIEPIFRPIKKGPEIGAYASLLRID